MTPDEHQPDWREQLAKEVEAWNARSKERLAATMDKTAMKFLTEDPEAGARRFAFKMLRTIAVAFVAGFVLGRAGRADR